jgi:hypothetical protein
MDNSPKKTNQLLAKDREVGERESLMLYIVNMGSPYEGWGYGEEFDPNGERGPIAWTPEEYKEFTARLREETEKHWPELWQPIENQNTAGETRAWEILLKMRTYLRKFWRADNDRERDWYIHRAREYHYGRRILPDLLKLDEAIRHTAAEGLLDEPPERNPIEKALYELQKRAVKPKYAPRVCPNECEQRYFLSNEKGQKYCPDCRRSESLSRQRNRASKRNSYHQHKGKWPSTAKRKKDHG